MKLARSRLVAGALSLAVVGSATGGVIAAQADDSAPRAQAAQQGGVSITPARVEATAKTGTVGIVHRQEHHQGHAAGHGHRPPVEPEPRHRGGRDQQAREPVAVRRRAARSRSTSSRATRSREAEHEAHDRVAARSTAASRCSPSRRRRRRRNGIIPQYEVIGAPAPEPDAQAPEPARRRHRRRRPRQRPLADPRRPQHRQHARPGRRHGQDHGPDGAQRHDPAGRRRPRPGRLPQGRRAARHEGRQLHRHVDDHAGRQALHRQARPSGSRVPGHGRASRPPCQLESEIMEEIWARSEATVRDVQEALNARGGQGPRVHDAADRDDAARRARGCSCGAAPGGWTSTRPAIAARRVPAGARRGRGRRAGRGLRRSRARALRAAHRHGSTRSGWRSSAGWRTVAETCGAAPSSRSPRSASTAFLLALIFVARRGALPRRRARRRARRGCRSAEVARARRAADRARAVRPVRARARLALDLARRVRASPRRRPDAGARRSARSRAGTVSVVAGARAAGVLRRAAAPARVRLRGRAGAPERGRAGRRRRARGASRRRGATRCGSWSRARSATRTRCGALPRREQALAELAADAAAVRRGGAAPLASALLAFHDDGADRPGARRPAGRRTRPRDEVPRALVAGAARRDRRPASCCSLAGAAACPATRASACRWRPPRSGGCARSRARLAAMGPAWLGWRRAGAFLLRLSARRAQPFFFFSQSLATLTRLRVALEARDDHGVVAGAALHGAAAAGGDRGDQCRRPGRRRRVVRLPGERGCCRCRCRRRSCVETPLPCR